MKPRAYVCSRISALFALALPVACGTSASPSSQTGTGAGGAVANATGGTGVGTGGTTGAGGSAITPIPEAGTPNETLCGDVQLTQTKTIAAGTTVAICAGATIHASKGASLTVQGTLLSQGTQASPVKLQAATAGPTGWAGLVLAKGGAAIVTFTEIHDAITAVTTQPGSSYSIDHLTIDGSSHLANLQSSGTISHSVWHGLGASQSGVVVQITNASPKLTDTLIDNSNQSTDMLHVDGTTSAASFDHMDISQAHCALHFDQGTNCSVTNSNLHDTQYGLMVLSSKTSSISHNNFQSNVNNIGSCYGGTATITDNYFQGAPFDGTCSSLTSSKNASAAFTDVGPQP